MTIVGEFIFGFGILFPNEKITDAQWREFQHIISKYLTVDTLSTSETDEEEEKEKPIDEEGRNWAFYDDCNMEKRQDTGWTLLAFDPEVVGVSSEEGPPGSAIEMPEVLPKVTDKMRKEGQEIFELATVYFKPKIKLGLPSVKLLYHVC
jgi:hypothetical protein